MSVRFPELMKCLLLLVVASQVGCQILGTGQSSSSEETPAGQVPVKSLTMEELELKLARLWARLDELHAEQLMQAQYIELLEEGLTLGLVPERLKQLRVRTEMGVAKDAMLNGAVEDRIPQKLEANLASAADVDDEKTMGEVAKAYPSKQVTHATSEDNKSYQDSYAKAHEQYRLGRFGQAILSFSEIIKTYEGQVDISASRYWVARSWFDMKEYQTALNHYSEIVQTHPDSPWIPRAKVDIARCSWQLGMKEQAVNTYKEIIADYPYEEASELAKMELRQLQNHL